MDKRSEHYIPSQRQHDPMGSMSTVADTDYHEAKRQRVRILIADKIATGTYPEACGMKLMDMLGLL